MNSFAVGSLGIRPLMNGKWMAKAYWFGFCLSISCAAYTFNTIGVAEGLQALLAPILSFSFFGRKLLR